MDDFNHITRFKPEEPSSLAAMPGSVTVICESIFKVEAALDGLCAVLHHDKALQSEANMILVTFRQRRLALEAIQRESQNESSQATLTGRDSGKHRKLYEQEKHN